MGKFVRSQLVDALIVDVIRMRVAQRRFYVTRAHRDLVPAKFQENAVDQVLDRLVPGWARAADGVGLFSPGSGAE